MPSQWLLCVFVRKHTHTHTHIQRGGGKLEGIKVAACAPTHTHTHTEEGNSRVSKWLHVFCILLHPCKTLLLSPKQVMPPIPSKRKGKREGGRRGIRKGRGGAGGGKRGGGWGGKGGRRERVKGEEGVEPIPKARSVFIFQQDPHSPISSAVSASPQVPVGGWCIQ